MATYQEVLDSITHGMAPEEGDFNTATLLGDDVPEWKKQELRESLRRVELGLPEPPEREDEEFVDIRDLEVNEDDWEEYGFEPDLPPTSEIIKVPRRRW